ncbi:oligosaccharide flippase family protein [Vibrio vulnificus]
MYISRELSLGLILRALTLLSKFLLVFTIAGGGNNDILIIYTVFFSIISYSVYFVNFDLYTYSTRKIAKANKVERFSYVYKHVISTFLICIFTLPSIYIVFEFGLLKFEYVYFFYFILLLEFFTTEVYRFMVACHQPDMALRYLFFKSGIWPIFYSILYYIGLFDSIESLLIVWLVILALVLLLGVKKVGFLCEGRFSDRFDFSYIKKALKVALPLLISTLAIRGIFTFDKIFLSEYDDANFVAAYMFFSNISNAILAFLDASVLIALLPKLVSSYDDELKFSHEFRVGVSKTIFVSMFLSIAVVVFCFLVIKLPKYSYFSEYFYLSIVISLSIFFLGVSFVYSIYFYSIGKDVFNIVINVTCFSVFFILCLTFDDKKLVPYYVLGGCFFLLLLKFIACLYCGSEKIRNEDGRHAQ